MKKYSFQISRYIREYVIVEVEGENACQAARKCAELTRDQDYMNSLICDHTWIYDIMHDPFDMTEIILVDKEGNLISADEAEEIQ